MERSYPPDSRSSATPALTIRCDASATVGGGHLLRCIALGQAWRDRGGSVAFLSRAPAALAERIRDESFELVLLDEELPEAAAVATFLARVEARGGWAVLDGYAFALEDERRVRAVGPLLVLDDYAHRPCYAADALLNQNAGAERLPYRFDGEPPVLLLGTRYTLLRREFAVAPRPEPRDVAERVLLTLGNGELPAAMATALAALAALAHPVDVRAVVGEATTAEAVLRDASVRPQRLELVRGGPAMPALMGWADLAVSAGGSTCWELAFMGVPTVAVTLADNQRPLAAALAEAGAGVDLGPADVLAPSTLTAAVDALLAAPARRAAMSAAGRRLVDGGGADRVVDALLRR